MKCKSNFTSKDISLFLDDYMGIQPVAHALSTELRLKIIYQIANRGMSINELARELQVPVSTVALNVQVLENAGVITCDTQPGAHGTMKICNRRIDSFHISLQRDVEKESGTRVYDMPVGCYCVAGDIQPTCGLAGADGPFHMDDEPAAFYYPHHFSADLIWMRRGYVEYNFPALDTAVDGLEYLEFSFEACAEAPCFRNDWPSDIYVCINGVEIGIWHCPGDFGGRRGLLNPEWWNESNTQYGHLKTWRVDHRGTMLESSYISGVSLESLALEKRDHIALRIGCKDSGSHGGGLNLFGSTFGDFAQDIRMRYVTRTQA